MCTIKTFTWVRRWAHDINFLDRNRTGRNVRTSEEYNIFRDNHTKQILTTKYKNFCILELMIISI